MKCFDGTFRRAHTLKLGGMWTEDKDNFKTHIFKIDGGGKSEMPT